MAEMADLASVLARVGVDRIPDAPSPVFGIGAGSFAGLRFGQRAGLGVDIEFEPSVQIITKRLRELGDQFDIKSYKEPLKEAIQKVMAPSFQKNFDVGGRPPWAPLAEYTKKIKERIGQDKGILVRSGTLRGVAGQLNIWEIDGQRGMAYVRGFPKRAWYGALHQEGSEGIGFEVTLFGGDTRAMGHLPPRVFIVAQREDVAAVNKIFEKWVGERIDRWHLSRGGL